jgi:hypothetical protein
MVGNPQTLMKTHLTLFQDCANRYYTKSKIILKSMAAYTSALTQRVGVMPI